MDPRRLLSKTDRELLARARRTARSHADEIKVGAYLRKYYRLPWGETRRLARWEDVETAVLSLCRTANRTQVLAADKEKAKRIVAWMQDTFGV